MASQDRLAELMESVQKLGTNKTETGKIQNGALWQPGRELNRGNAPTPGSIGQRGDEGGGPGTFFGGSAPGSSGKSFIKVDSDSYDGPARPKRVDGIYDYQMMLRLFANR